MDRVSPEARRAAHDRVSRVMGGGERATDGHGPRTRTRIRPRFPVVGPKCINDCAAIAIPPQLSARTGWRFGLCLAMLAATRGSRRSCASRKGELDVQPVVSALLWLSMALVALVWL